MDVSDGLKEMNTLIFKLAVLVVIYLLLLKTDVLFSLNQIIHL